MYTNFIKIYTLLTLVITILSPHYVFASETNIREGYIDHTNNKLDDDNDVLQRKGKKESDYKISETIQLETVNDRRILVKTNGADRVISQVDHIKLLEVSSLLTKQGYQLIRVPEGINFNQKLNEIRNHPMVEEAEPDYLRESTFRPSDLDYSRQWYLKPLGMEKAWQVNRGSTNVKVAVLDTGVNANHPDLVGRILPGYDFVNRDNDPSDDNGHGTHIAGLIGANTDHLGIAGVDHNAKILPVKTMNEKGSGSVNIAVEGIYYAIEQGVDVINMSYGSSQRSSLEEKALWEAYNQGIVLIAAAGNENTNEWSYPASYVPVISVAATGKNGEIAPFSNYGQWIDLTAPGVDMYSTKYTGGYGASSGTSYSAPLVSGLAALLRAQNPSWKPRDIEWALQSSAWTSNGAEWNSLDGFGIIDGYQALTSSLPSLDTDASDLRKQGIELTNREPFNEKIDMPMDVDWFRFTVKQKSPVTINLADIPGHLDLAGALRQYDGDTASRNTSIDHMGMGESESYTFEADPGEYYLAVYDYFNHWSGVSYTIDVTIENHSVNDSKVRFPDVVGSWAEDEINYLAGENLISGYPNGNFGIHDNINRAAAATIIVRELGLSLEHGDFQDVKDSHWASEYIGAASKAGIITGYETNLFKPDAPLSREEMATIIVRAYNFTGSGSVEFTDVNRSSWSYDYIDRLVANRITVGYPDQTFKPKSNIKRSEFSVMVARVLNDSFKP